MNYQLPTRVPKGRTRVHGVSYYTQDTDYSGDAHFRIFDRPSRAIEWAKRDDGNMHKCFISMDYNPEQINFLLDGLKYIQNNSDYWNQYDGLVNSVRRWSSKQVAIECGACAAAWANFFLLACKLIGKEKEAQDDAPERDLTNKWVAMRNSHFDGEVKLSGITRLGRDFQEDLFVKHGAADSPWGASRWKKPLYDVFCGVFKERFGHIHQPLDSNGWDISIDLDREWVALDVPYR